MNSIEKISHLKPRFQVLAILGACSHPQTLPTTPYFLNSDYDNDNFIRIDLRKLWGVLLFLTQRNHRHDRFLRQLPRRSQPHRHPEQRRGHDLLRGHQLGRLRKTGGLSRYGHTRFYALRRHYTVRGGNKIGPIRPIGHIGPVLPKNGP